MLAPMKHALLGAGMLAALSATSALAGVPFPTRETAAPVDTGLLDAHAGTTPITVTIALKLRDLAGAEALITHLSTKGDRLYRQYLTPAQFAERFGPTDAAVQKVRDALTPFGLTVTRASTTTLKVTGLPANLERAFQVSLHEFQVPAKGSTKAYTFRAPVQRETLPGGIADVAHGVLGLDNRPAFHPNYVQSAAHLRPGTTKLLSHPATTPPDQPGNWTVVDFADYYDVNPLYARGITGAGRNIGIMTLASFTPSDAYTYWAQAGLTVSQTRITEVPVDGGSGPPSDDSGSIETTLDTEQSGGIATGANIMVYEAPNTAQGIVDVFGNAVDANATDALSISWGEWEWFDTFGNNGAVTNPVTGSQSSVLAAIHDVLAQAATQGQTTYAAAGDAGAYDVNRGAPPPDFSLVLSVDYPGSDSLITSAGGDTIPATITFTNPPITVTIPKERVWSWDYLVPLCDALTPPLDPVDCGIFPVGGGGGVSIRWPLPSFQKATAGMQTTQPDQEFTDYDFVPPKTYYVLPVNFAGRNVPDFSLNADPETGYVIGYTSSASGSTYQDYNYYGGTSFVAPQMNGVTQLLAQDASKRIGFINTALYAQANLQSGYQGAAAPLIDIKSGNNDFYRGAKGYSPAAGVGAFHVSNLAKVLQ